MVRFFCPNAVFSSSYSGYPGQGFRLCSKAGQAVVSRAGARTRLQPAGGGDAQGFDSSSAAFFLSKTQRRRRRAAECAAAHRPCPWRRAPCNEVARRAFSVYCKLGPNIYFSPSPALNRCRRVRPPSYFRRIAVQRTGCRTRRFRR